MEFKPDLEATEFSYQNAFFFSKMSRIAYSTREEVRDLMQGDGTNKGLGFDHFYWFEVILKKITVIQLVGTICSDQYVY